MARAGARRAGPGRTTTAAGRARCRGRCGAARARPAGSLRHKSWLVTLISGGFRERLGVMLRAALIPRLTFVAEQSRRLARSDALLQLLDFQLNLLLLHLASPPRLRRHAHLHRTRCSADRCSHFSQRRQASIFATRAGTVNNFALLALGRFPPATDSHPFCPPTVSISRLAASWPGDYDLRQDVRPCLARESRARSDHPRRPTVPETREWS